MPLVKNVQTRNWRPVKVVDEGIEQEIKMIKPPK